MAYFRHIVTRSDGSGSHVSGITALVAQDRGTEGLRLYSASGSQGGLLQRDAAQSFRVTAEQAYSDLPVIGGSGSFQRSSEAGLTALSLGGREVLISYGQSGGARGFWQDGAGGIGRAFDLGIGSGTVLSMTALSLGGGADVIFVSTLQGLGVSSYLRLSNGSVTPLQQLVGAGGVIGYDVLALDMARVGGTHFLLTATAQSNCISAYQIGNDGRATLVDCLSNADGFSVTAPNLLETIDFAGRSLVLVGASGTGSITVLELAETGKMRVLDQVGDDLNSRFQSISVLKAVTLGDRVFVVAGGADDGLTLMTLLPDGRLLALETIADSLTTTLDNPSALEVVARAGGLDVFASAWGNPGVTQFRVEPGVLAPMQIAGATAAVLRGDQRADLLAGGAGHDVLYGGDGADILMDGAGSDTLWGGTGADTFVLRGDGVVDEIRDFELGVDVLDLSGWGRIYARESLGFGRMAGGIRLFFGEEELKIYSRDGARIQPEDIGASNFAGLSHLGPVQMPVIGREISGGQAADMLLGKSGEDTIQGGRGADVVNGEGGNDLLTGERLDPVFDAAAGQIYRVYRATLDRAPDWAGHFSWTQTLVNGNKSLGRIIADFVASAEFQARYGATSDSQFVTLLYQNVLGRAPDPAGQTSWTTALSSGRMSRSEVVAGFSESREFQDGTAASSLAFGRAGHQNGWLDDVFRLYRATLARDPDYAGLTGWTEALAGGQSFMSVVRSFVASPEFLARYGTTTDGQFVTLLYQNVLGRAPDPAGFASWTAALASGRLGRDAVVQGFAQSAEFVSATTPRLDTYMKAQALDDRILGGAGDNLLMGGIGADVFVFLQDDGGKQRVADLQRWDHVELQGFGYATAAAAMLHLRQNGRDVVFEDQGVEIWFADRRLADFDAGIFIL